MRLILNCFLFLQNKPIAALGLFVLFSSQDVAAQEVERATSQTIYVPAYARVLTKEGNSEPVASTLVVHNVDQKVEIVVSKIEYYSSEGELLENLLSDDVQLTPFQSTYALVPIDGLGDGIGANFIVEWSSETLATPPIVEAVMVGGSGTQGISFSSRGHVIVQSP